MKITTQILAFGFVLSFLLSALIVSLAKKVSVLTVSEYSGPQTIHIGQVPRIGGAAVVIAVGSQMYLTAKSGSSLPWLIYYACLPVFLAGFLEDVCGLVSAKKRFFASVFTGFCFWFLTGFAIVRVDFEPMDKILSLQPVSVGLSILAVASFANATNLIDGLNGLASGAAMIALAAISIVGVQVANESTVFIALSMLVAIAGFVIWNFPSGRLFLGDGGAYFIGAVISGLLIAMVYENSLVSPFFALAIVAYPFYELVRTTTRRAFGKGENAFHPDNKHLHSLVFRCLLLKTTWSRTSQNNVASMLVLLLPLFSCAWAVGFYNNTVMLISGTMALVVLYEFSQLLVMSWIAREKSPDNLE